MKTQNENAKLQQIFLTLIKLLTGILVFQFYSFYNFNFFNGFFYDYPKKFYFLRVQSRFFTFQLLTQKDVPFHPSIHPSILCVLLALFIYSFLSLPLPHFPSLHTRIKRGVGWGQRKKRQIERIDRKNVFLSPSLPHLCLCVFTLSYYYSCSAPSLYRPSALASVPQAFYLSVSFSHSSHSLASSRGVPVFCLVLPFLPPSLRSFVRRSLISQPSSSSRFNLSPQERERGRKIYLISPSLFSATKNDSLSALIT